MSQSILFFGLPCSFADTVLSEVLVAGHEVRARVIPGQPRSAQPYQQIYRPRTSGSRVTLPIAGSRPSLHGSPIYQINDHYSTATRELLTAFDADVAIVCCYTQRIPNELMSTTLCGGLNIHPSLLPAYRGPEPLFWIYRNGEKTTGVTVHQVVDQLDAGPIVQQQRINIPIGKPGNELWEESAETGGFLIIKVLHDLESSMERAQLQSEANSTYQSWPSTNDLVINPREWDSWRVAHFCTGVIPLGYQPVVVTTRGVQKVRRVLEYATRSGKRFISDTEQTVSLECRDGNVIVELVE